MCSEALLGVNVVCAALRKSFIAEAIYINFSYAKILELTRESFSLIGILEMLGNGLLEITD